MSEKKQILIVGAGAAGLTAAIFAAREGASVTILEQNERPGKKINATGNGKCNLTNLAFPKDAYRGTHPEFVKSALSQFSTEDTLNFFSQLGIYPVNRNGYIYPRSAQAQSVTDALVSEAIHLGIKIKTQESAVRIERTPKGFTVYTQGWHYSCGGLLLANGSMASAIAGSGDSGYTLASSLGHTVIKPLPALCALKCKGKSFQSWAGVRTEGEVTLLLDGMPFHSAKGELQLTEYGISGIPVFQLSRYAVRALDAQQAVSLSVDFFPELSQKEFEELLQKRKEQFPYKTEKEQLSGLFPDKLVKVLCSQKACAAAAKAFPLTVTSGMPFAQAQVCSGGVDTGEVHAETMESRLVPGLYFAGELLDIDGTCGGYNLQWAWSSGAVAGAHIAKEQKTL